MKFKLNALLFAIIAAMGIWSCGPKKETIDGEDGTQENQVSPEIIGIIKAMPKPSEVPYILQATGAEFNPSLVSDRNKAESYISQSEKTALNMGIYAADIGYLSSYDKTQESIDYLNTCKMLADALGVSASIDKSILDRFESNIGNKDSLAAILNQSFNHASQYLLEANRSKMAALLVTGSFVESLYVSTGIIKSYPKNILPDDSRILVLTPLMRLVIDQKKSVGMVTKLLSLIEPTGSIPAILTDLKSLESTYNALTFEEKLKNNKANLALSDDTLAEITKIVEKLRLDIVQ